MNIAILTISIGDEYIKTWKSFLKTKEIYCNIHNYNFIQINESLDKKRKPHWTKIKAIEQYLKSYDWIFYSDADVNIMNFDIKLEDIINKYSDNKTFLIISKDNVEINSGNFFIKNCKQSFNFLKEVYNEYPTKNLKIGKYIINWNDQYGLYKVYQRKEYIQQVKIINQRIINSYPCHCCGEKYKIGDFLIHFVNHKRNTPAHNWLDKNQKDNINLRDNLLKSNTYKNILCKFLENLKTNIEKVKYNREIIISLTTIPSRLKNCISTIKTIRKQSIFVDKIILSIPLKSIREPSNNIDDYDLNEKILSELNDVTIYRCKKDYGPATKLLGILEIELEKKHKNTDTEPLIITIDDDKLYNHDMILNLIKGWERNSLCAVSRTGSIIKNVNNKIKEYPFRGCDLKKDINVDILFGSGAILYKPSFFDKSIFDFKLVDKNFENNLSFYIDDGYISYYLRYKGIKKKVIKFNENYVTNYFKKLKIFAVDINSGNNIINPLKIVNRNRVNRENSKKLFIYFNNLINKKKKLDSIKII